MLKNALLILFVDRLTALRYARLYHVDRANWKFNKAKQEYLIRHMLTPPIENDGAVPGGEKGEEAAKNEEEEEKGAERGASDQHWPDEWNRCVAKYLVTIQGKAKQRLLDILNEAARREIPPIAQDVAAAGEGQEHDSDAVAPSVSTLGAKSVSFGDLAMEQQSLATSQSSVPNHAGALSAKEVSRIQFEKERAGKMLLELHD
jgi:hypothetical protein